MPQELNHHAIKSSDLFLAKDQQIHMDTLKLKKQHGSGINLKLVKKMPEEITSLMLLILLAGTLTNLTLDLRLVRQMHIDNI